ncbi:MAG TPA: alcohol dehydrogenase catalytic domain-containing protein [Solirubrobacteraceae bacterium]|nr:alcohol dehydrogenase catalytic domain-containing protein [Solirubrobacteraceae bacterium]
MRAIEVAEDRRLVAVECPAPEPGPAQVVLDVAYCGICGSDLHFREVPELFPAGTVPGHEFSGRIAAVGDHVVGWSAGDRVCVLPFGQCGECDACRDGHEQVCPHAVSNGVGLGTGRPGAYAGQVVVDERMLFSLPDSVDDRAGTLVEPLAVAIRAVDQASVVPDEPVLVLGAGPIGLLTALVLRHRGARRTRVCSRNPARARRAAALGLVTVSIDELGQTPPAQSPACVFDCAGTPASAQLAVQTLRPLGRLLLVGLSLAPLDLPAPAIVLKELAIQGVIAYRRAQFQAAIDMLAAGAIPVGELITEVVPLAQAEAAFQALTARGGDKLKILLAP